MDKSAYKRLSDNVEVRDPNDPVEKASVDQMLHDLRNKRALMQGMLNEPANIWRREEMEKWLADPVNDPDFNTRWDAKGQVERPGPTWQEHVNIELGRGGKPVKPMPEITAGTGMDRRTATVALKSQEPAKSQGRLPFGSEYHGLADSEVPE